MRIYVAGPYTQGDPILNTRRAIDAGQRLMEAGHSPFVPHLSAFWHLVHEVEYERWLEYDFEWIKVCDALLRLSGHSPGSEREVKLANELGIPVYYSVEEVLEAD